jgi:hypothetical protein
MRTLTWIFLSLTMIVLSIMCLSIYFFSENSRREDFYSD